MLFTGPRPNFLRRPTRYGLRFTTILQSSDTTRRMPQILPPKLNENRAQNATVGDNIEKLATSSFSICSCRSVWKEVKCYKTPETPTRREQYGSCSFFSSSIRLSNTGIEKTREQRYTEQMKRDRLCLRVKTGYVKDLQALI